jgi:predicted amidophosphoribosyltransferase
MKETRCEQCRSLMFAMAIGQCRECGGATTSIAEKLCEACARRLGVCRVCGRNMENSH